ncbi:MAG: DUF998 domain-containing protein [Candidatus Saccharimonadales bacterium]|jgi:hypothetical protein
MNRLIISFGLCGALLYNNWLLGYWLNSRVTIGSLASDLQIHSQPYSWIFILGDILSGLMIAITAYLIYRLWQPYDRLKLYLLIGYLCFGVFTAAAAIMPIHCGANSVQCALSSNQTFGIHDIVGALASFGQFISLITLWRLSVNIKKPSWFKWLMLGFLLLWSLAGIVFLILTFQRLDEVAMQHVFLIFTFLGLVPIPLSVRFIKANHQLGSV